METFSALLSLCAGNSPVTGDFSSQWPVTWSFDVFFHMCLSNGWVNIRNAGDLRRHRVHNDVTVMWKVNKKNNYKEFTLNKINVYKWDPIY